MSSATRNDSKNPASWATASSFSLGMTMVVSTDSINSEMPRSACCMRRLPSKANGLVTTATVSAPISLASEAMMGAAPVPVPPPSPAVTKTMSAPSSASMILSESSSAALRPISGLAPAPRPLVSLTPSWIFIAARDIRSACRSVFATTNSMPSIPASIMRFTAFPPPPPTPMTLILASLRASSLKLMRISLSFFMSTAFSEFPCSCCFPNPGAKALCLSAPILRLGTMPSRLPFRVCPLDFCLLPNFLFSLRALSGKHGLQPGTPALVLDPASNTRPVPIEHHAKDCRVLRLGQRRWHLRQRRGPGQAHRTPQYGLGDVQNSRQTRGASTQHHASHAQIEHPGVAQVVAQHLKQFPRPRFKDFSHRALRDQPRRAIADRGNLHFIALRDERHDGVAIKLLDFFRLRERCAEAQGKVAGEVIAANRNHYAVCHRTFLKHDQAGRACAKIR